jgi:hypothetical protein
LAHRALDEAVFAAYGLAPAATDEAILAARLEMNHRRAGAEVGQEAGKTYRTSRS